MNIQVENGPAWPADPRFVPVCGFDSAGQPKPFVFGTAGAPSADAMTVQGRAGMTPIIAAGVTTRAAVEFTRPADTTQYAINDCVSNATSGASAIVFPNAARVAGGTGIILSARVVTNNAATTNASFRLWILNQGLAVGDNSAFAMVYSEANRRIGYVDFTLGTEGTGSDCATGIVTGINLPYSAAAGSRDLYAVLVAKAAYAPASGQKFTLELGVAND